jgi:hypothetical protein
MAKKKAAAKHKVPLLSRKDADLIAHALECLGNEMKYHSHDETYTKKERLAYVSVWADCERLLNLFDTGGE